MHKHNHIRSRLYSIFLTRPKYVPISKRTVSKVVTRKSPRMRSIFCTFRPEFRKCQVRLREGRRSDYFWIFYKAQSLLDMLDMRGGGVWNGDLLVVRASKKDKRLGVNMRGQDSGLADFMIHEYAVLHNHRILNLLLFQIY
jgi:hypothetical protein